MKPTHTLRSFLLIAGSSLLAISSATAQVYWDTDGGTAGFGTASGTWGTDAFWNTDDTGGAGTFSTTTTGTVNFGNGATGLGSGTINVGTVTSGNMTFASGSGAILLSGGTITMAAAATITVDNTTNTINSVLTGSTTSLTKLGTGTLILSGANNYTGATYIDGGTLQVNSGGTLGATGKALRIGTGTASALGNAANLTLNTDFTVGAFTVVSNTADVTTASNINQLSIANGSTLTASSFTMGISSTVGVNTALSTGSTPGAGGTLTVSGLSTIGLQGPDSADTNITVADLRGLHTFNSGELRLGNNRNSRATLYLANNANTINGNITVGSSGGTNNYNVAGTSYLHLGAGTNALQAGTITIGGVKGAGQILFDGSSGSVEITGLDGSGTSTINVGSHGASSYQGTQTNSLLLAGHTATVAAGVVTLGQITANNAGAGNALNSLLTFDTGTFNATSVTMGLVSNGRTSLTHAINSEFKVGGDTANSAATGIVNVIGNVLLGNNDGTGTSTGATSSTLTINGGTVNVNTAAATTGGIFDGSANVVVGVSLTSTLTLEGGTLDLNGGRIGGTGTPTGSVGARNIDNLNFRSGTLIDVASINNNQGLTKTTSGTLNLDGTNSYTGGTSVTEGTLVFLKTTAKPSGGTHAFDAGTTLGLGVATSGSFFTATDVTNAFAGTMTGNLSNVTVTATTNVGIDTTAGDFTYSTSISGSPTKGLTKLGANTLTLSGTNTYTGTTTIEAGTLELGVDNCLDNTNVEIGAGILAAATDVNDSVGTLDVTAAATINLSSGATLAFADSSAVDWAGGTLNITGTFVSGSSVKFGTTSGGLTPTQLGLITINDVAGSYTLDGSGFLTSGGDVTPPTLTSITDNVSGGPITEDDSVTYTVTFSEDIDSTTVTTTDFDNQGTATLTINSVVETAPTSGIFTVVATPSTPGTLRLRIPTGAVVEDTSGNDLVVPVSDDTEITVLSKYEDWSGAADFDADTNGDGVSNGLAFLLGAANKNDSALSLLPTVTHSGGDLILTFDMLNAANRKSAALSIEHSRDLGDLDDWTTVLVPNANGGPTSGVTFLVTPGSPNNSVTATINASEAGGTGKLFGRLKAQP